MSEQSRHVVVDGSNIATEGRQIPSLAQLESAVAELKKDLPDAVLTVVVDATFAHRIDPAELARFEAAALAGEYVSPPAGAIGRGDAFLLRIAEKVDATVLSNDSFQEFHGEHPWLFDTGRLLGATPVPGIGWIFIPRTPVRGPRSRVAVRDAGRQKSRVEKAIAAATAEATDPSPAPSASRTRRRQSPAAPSEESTPAARPAAVNEPTVFISFIAEHPLGAQVEGVVDSFTSHGAVVLVGEVRCYVPLSGLGSPPPRSAREVLRKGEVETFAVTALDPHRRGVELALPGVGEVRGAPSEETVLAEVAMTRPRRRTKATEESMGEPSPSAPSQRRRRSSASAALAAVNGEKPADAAASAAPPKEPGPADAEAAPPRRRRSTRTPAPEPAAEPPPDAARAARPRSRRTSAAAEVQAPPVEVAPTPTPRKRSAARKSTAPAVTPPAAPADAPPPARRSRGASKAVAAVAAAPPAEPRRRRTPRTAGS